MQYFQFIFGTIYLLTVIFAVIVISLEHRTPLKAASWILAVILLPIFGMILYLNFGRRFRKAKIFNRKGLTDFMWLEELSLFQINSLKDENLQILGPVQSKINIIKLLLGNNKSILTAKNELTILHNGAQTFTYLLDDLRNAEQHIHLEYYIFEDDKIGNTIREILIQKAGEGLEIRFIYDDVGSWSLGRKFLRSMHEAGIEIGCFMPVRIPLFAHKVNYRNHRKIVVIDGKVGYVGGINVADKYIEGDPELGPWRDTHLKIHGHAVQSLQSLFLADWFFVTRILLDDPKYFPSNPINKRQLVQITSSGPDSDWGSIMQAYFTAITTAEKYIYISTPYFLPNESIFTGLVTAALRGVDVRMLLPGRADLTVIRWGSLSYVERLLEAGVKVYLYEKGFNHGKIMMVDDVFSSVGTANMDVRSFDKNFEVNALIYDEEATRELVDEFRKDLEKSKEILLDEFRKRPFGQRLKEAVARLVSPLL
jgi:cardiolipin synthase